jgi:hypothetical protein
MSSDDIIALNLNGARRLERFDKILFIITLSNLLAHRKTEHGQWECCNGRMEWYWNLG